jgi:uncharacterized membrane protein
MTRERLALIQGHAELVRALETKRNVWLPSADSTQRDISMQTTQSIAQLEQLHSEPSSSLIDYLHT